MPSLGEAQPTRRVLVFAYPSHCPCDHPPIDAWIEAWIEALEKSRDADE